MDQPSRLERLADMPRGIWISLLCTIVVGSGWILISLTTEASVLPLVFGGCLLILAAVAAFLAGRNRER